MANKLVIEYVKRIKQLEHEIKQVPPVVYASIAIAMHNAGVDIDAIADIFAESQRIWMEHGDNGTIQDMIDKCEEITGITLTYKE